MVILYMLTWTLILLSLKRLVKLQLLSTSSVGIGILADISQKVDIMTFCLTLTCRLMFDLNQNPMFKTRL